MKTQQFNSHPTRSGFSLVELLVVIAIIAGLAAIAFPIAGKMIKSGDLEKNREITKALELSIDRFYEKYGYYPADLDGKSDTSNFTDQSLVDVLIELEGKEDDLEFNINGINFIEAIPEGSNGRGGIIRTSSGEIDMFINKSGQEFNLRFDTDFDNAIDEPSLDLEDQGEEVRGKRTLIWSYGEELDNKDDIITNWR